MYSILVTFYFVFFQYIVNARQDIKNDLSNVTLMSHYYNANTNTERSTAVKSTRSTGCKYPPSTDSHTFTVLANNQTQAAMHAG